MSRPLKDKLDVFEALAHPVRRELIAAMKGGALPATALVAKFKMSQPALSHHLQVLRRAGVVKQQQAGRQRLYLANAVALRQAHRWLSKQLD